MGFRAFYKKLPSQPLLGQRCGTSKFPHFNRSQWKNSWVLFTLCPFSSSFMSSTSLPLSNPPFPEKGLLLCSSLMGLLHQSPKCLKIKGICCSWASTFKGFWVLFLSFVAASRLRQGSASGFLQHCLKEAPSTHIYFDNASTKFHPETSKRKN